MIVLLIPWRINEIAVQSQEEQQHVVRCLSSLWTRRGGAAQAARSSNHGESLELGLKRRALRPRVGGNFRRKSKAHVRGAIIQPPTHDSVIAWPQETVEEHSQDHNITLKNSHHTQ